MKKLNKKYVSGRNFEYRVKKYMEELGWIVFRTAGSHTVADLVCLEDSDGYCGVALIQCKYRKGGGLSINKKEVKELEDLVNALSICGYVAFNDVNGHIMLRFVGRNSLNEKGDI